MNIYIPAKLIDDIAFHNGYGLSVAFLKERVKRTGNPVIVTFGEKEDPHRSTMTIKLSGEVEYQGPYLLGHDK